MPRQCVVSTCRNHAVSGGSRCRTHSNSNWGSYKPAHAVVYRSRRWTDLRTRVLREEPVCAEEGCMEKATSVDHIVSLAEGVEPYDRSNLRGMCHEHHQRRSSQQGAATRKRGREAEARRKEGA